MQLGLEHAPTLCIDHPGSDVLRTYRIADNHLAELADWDDETLVIELQELQFGRNPLNSCVIAPAPQKRRTETRLYGGGWKLLRTHLSQFP